MALARACHKGEPKRPRLRVAEEARLGDKAAKNRGGMLCPGVHWVTLGGAALSQEQRPVLGFSGRMQEWNGMQETRMGQRGKAPVGPTLTFVGFWG